jgi:D-glycero-D-manno-heptose 1,7-bisphosphate phosphatase
MRVAFCADTSSLLRLESTIADRAAAFLDRLRAASHNPRRMKRPAIFFDRDNTLIISSGYLGDPSQVELVPGAADAVARAKRLGYVVAALSNQSGVARGLFTEDDVHAVNKRIDELLRNADPDAVIDRHDFCPFHPEAVLEEYRRDSDLRKPRPGMIHLAEQQMQLDLSRSWVIGDAPRDIEAGIAAGCRTILFHDPTLPASPAAEAELKVQPDRVVTRLTEAIDFIESESEPLQQRVGVKPVGIAAPEEPIRTALPAPTRELERLERLAEQILLELRRKKDEPAGDFSVSRLLAGMVQVITLAIAFMSYLNRGTPAFQSLMLLAIFLQALTIALLIMGRMR